MPLREAEAFVLGSRPLGESDRLVTFLTRPAGRLRGVAKGARRSRRRFGSNLELLSRVRLTWFEREGHDLVRIESAELLESFYDLQGEPERGAVLAGFAEIADAFAREEQPDEAFFRLLQAVLAAVRGGLDLDRAARYFEIWTLRLHGILPGIEACASCGAGLAGRAAAFDRRGGGVMCTGCGRGAAALALPAAALREAADMLRRPPAEFIGRAVPPPALRPLAALAEAIFLEVTERAFKSYEVLRGLRGSGARGA